MSSLKFGPISHISQAGADASDAALRVQYSKVFDHGQCALQRSCGDERTSSPYLVHRDLIRKILAPVKVKSALPPPPQKNPKYPPPPQTRNFMDMVSPAERAHFSRRPQNWRSHFRPQNCGQKILRTRGFF